MSEFYLNYLKIALKRIFMHLFFGRKPILQQPPLSPFLSLSQPNISSLISSYILNRGLADYLPRAKVATHDWLGRLVELPRWAWDTRDPCGLA